MNNLLDQNLILKDKKVLLRVDLNVPMKNRAITEISRIEKIVPTIKLLIEKQAKIIVLSHIGRPKGKIVEEMSLEPISKKLAFLLKEFGLKVHKGIAKTGIVGVLQKGSSNKSIGIRADMDALPIQETNTFNYKSKIENRMHACGHDGHTTMLLGAAKHLAEHGNFDGTVYFIFQPDEENCFGAKTMIEEGLFTRFSIDEVYAMHNIPGMEVGTFATRKGTITSSENLFEISFAGKGGHAALPHMTKDAIMIGRQIIIALQTIVSRKIDPVENGVESVTDFLN